MRLADFILANVEPILAEWEVFARSIGAGESLDQLALRDHAGQILNATAHNMKSDQSPSEQAGKSKGQQPQGQESAALDGASDMHAMDRLNLGFDMLEVMSEYRALRASVLRLWHESRPGPGERDVEDLTRFNESIDQAPRRRRRELYAARRSGPRHVPRHPEPRPAQPARRDRDVRPRAAAPDEQPGEDDRVRAAHRAPRGGDGAHDRRSARLHPHAPRRGHARDPRAARPGRTRDGPRRGVSGGASRAGDSLHHDGRPARHVRLGSRPTGHLQPSGQRDPARCRRQPVSVELRGEADDIFIAIRNAGPPIPAGELPNIFNPLVRGSSALHPKVNRPGSIGMGLYIAREVAKSHGGVIDVTSTVEEGTCFTIRMPRKSPPEARAPILNAGDIRRM